ncbi:MAG: hypothetical protein SVM79_10090 [Chloroflexota bacterium]|nr:hypothetical protein [Chloroflexota bacterium]
MASREYECQRCMTWFTENDDDCETGAKCPICGSTAIEAVSDRLDMMDVMVNSGGG